MTAARARGSKVGWEREATPKLIGKVRLLIVGCMSYREAGAEVGLAGSTLYRKLPGGVRAVRDAAKIAA
jgi:DNA invertase Pin-like site-specific DNA recombinase